MRPALALAVAALVVLAGCGAFVDGPSDGNGTTTATTTTVAPTETTTETTEDATTLTTTGRDDRSADSGPALGIEVMQGELPYDPNTTYVRVQRLLGTNQSAPGAVMLVEGLAAPGQASNTGRVYLDTDDEAVLAHEFTHSIMLRAYPKPAVGSADQEFAANSLVEGAAEYVQAAYARQYLDRSYLGITRLPEQPGNAYFLARYHYGYRYFQARANSTDDVVAIHETPPNTSEQVIHGLPPSAEPPRSLAVSPASRHLESNATWR